MRPSKRVSLLTVLAAAGLAACSSEGGQSPDDFTPTSDDQIVSTTNPMGLRLQFDDASGHVRATVRSKLLSGEKLVLRVRRGRLAVGAAQLLDCSMLAEAPAIPPAAGASANAKIVYDGPAIDRSMLASVYSQDWIAANIAPNVLERLERDGSDSIVEACIVAPPAAADAGASEAGSPAAPTAMANAMTTTTGTTGAAVTPPSSSGTLAPRMRVSTSIQDAWDSNDPHMAPELRARNRAAAAATR